jgi:hypothetical protein
VLNLNTRGSHGRSMIYDIEHAPPGHVYIMRGSGTKPVRWIRSFSSYEEGVY